MAAITKELAIKIAKKLGAEIQKREGAHDLAKVHHKGKLIAHFGIRRGSRKDLGHDHIPEAIHIRTGQAKLLGLCPMLKDDWIKIMSEKGKL